MKGKTEEQFFKKLSKLVRSRKKFKIGRARCFENIFGISVLPNAEESSDFPEVVEYLFRSDTDVEKFDFLVNLNNVNLSNDWPTAMSRAKLADKDLARQESNKNFEVMAQLKAYTLLPDKKEVTDLLSVVPAAEWNSIEIPTDYLVDVIKQIKASPNGVFFRASLDGIRIDFEEGRVTFYSSNGHYLKSCVEDIEIDESLYGQKVLLRTTTCDLIADIAKAFDGNDDYEMTYIHWSKDYTVVQVGSVFTGMIRSVSRTVNHIDFNVVIRSKSGTSITLSSKTMKDLMAFLKKTKTPTFGPNDKFLSNSNENHVALVLSKEGQLRVHRVKRYFETKVFETKKQAEESGAMLFTTKRFPVELQRTGRSVIEDDYFELSSDETLYGLYKVQTTHKPHVRLDENRIVATVSVTNMIEGFTTLEDQLVDLSELFDQTPGPITSRTDNTLSIIMPVRTTYELGAWCYDGT